MSDELDPMGPAEAVEFYFRHRESELSKSTLENQRYRLKSFLDWCADEGIENMNDLTGRDLHNFRVARQQNVKKVTLNGHLQTLRVFLEFCATIDAVESGLRERVLMPEVDPEEEARDVELAPVELDGLSEAETAELSRSSNYTWEFRTSSSSSEGSAGGSVAPDRSVLANAVDGGDQTLHGG